MVTGGWVSPAFRKQVIVNLLPLSAIPQHRTPSPEHKVGYHVSKFIIHVWILVPRYELCLLHGELADFS